jgi:nucleoside-diphosphate-sugar epimerase
MIFVTGGSGLVGSHLIHQLIKKGRKVRAIYRNIIPKFALAEKVEWIKGDILDVLALEDGMKGVDEVYHCAAIVSFNPRTVQQMFRTNIEGTANVVNACLETGVKKLCYVSSVAALGRIRNNQEVNETMRWSEETSNSRYGRSKHLAEMEVWRGISEGLQAVIVNPVIILGAGDWNKGSSEIFKSAYKEFPWYTEGVTGFVDVQDVVDAMIQLMENNISEQRFILSEGNHTYKEVFSLIAKAFGKKPPHKKVSPLIASLIWRLEAARALFTGIDPLLTRETAQTAQAVVRFNNSKLFNYLPGFKYTPLAETIKRVCQELSSANNRITVVEDHRVTPQS